MSDRRSFLRCLASLPLIGGSVAIIGQPTAAAVPVTPMMLKSYSAWLFYERRMVSHELAGYDPTLAKGFERCIYMGNPGADYHFSWPDPNHRCAGWLDAPQPSTRAAVVLSAAGCRLA